MSQSQPLSPLLIAHPAFLPLDSQGNKRQRFSAIAEGVANARYAFTPSTPDSLCPEPLNLLVLLRLRQNGLMKTVL